MKFKKIMSTALAGAMALSMTTTALAATVNDLTEGAEMEVTGSTVGATISLTVPTSAAVIVNPYEIATKIPGTQTDSEDQLISPVYFVENNSSLDIEVGVALTGSVEGDVKLVETSTAASTGDDKNLFAFLDLKTVKGTDDAPSAWTAAASFSEGDTNILLATSEKTGKVSLKATDGATATAADTLAFKFVGTANKKSAAPWSDEDTVSAAIAFSFKVDNGTTTTPASPTP